MAGPKLVQKRKTKRWSTAVGLGGIIACALNFGAAFACSDYSVPKLYSLIQTDIENNLPFLAPSNDSRVNVLLLLGDAGLTHPRLPAPIGPETQPDPYAGQTPLDFDTLAEILNDRRRSADVASDFVDGEGDRCRSNAAARDAYLAALAASPAPKAEQAVLTKARNALGEACNDDARATIAVPATSIRSEAGKAFALYMGAAADFYAGDFAQARWGFANLTESRLPWLKEASRYMLARVDLNAAQATSFGDYGEMILDKVDRAALAKAEAGFRGYLKDYPNGSYVVSARGLLRRVAWLGGDSTKFADALGEAFAAADPKARNVSVLDLAYESDNKLLTQVAPKDIREPRLLAARDLMSMRQEPGSPATLTRAELEAQRPLFAAQKPLYDYLLAAYAFYNENDAAGALKILDAIPAGPNMSSVAFSQQVLKGLALEAVHKPAVALAHWLALIPLAEPILRRPAIELALALNYERGGELGTVFAKGSPIGTPIYRDVLLTQTAGPDLLRQRAGAANPSQHERELALHVLLYKELTRGRYRAFVDDLALMPATLAEPEPYSTFRTPLEGMPLDDFNWAGADDGDGFACPSIRAIGAALAQNPHAERSLICLGEFLRIHSYDGVLRNAPVRDRPGTVRPDELGTSPPQFPGVGISRLDIYRGIIANPKAAADVRAYALYRAINCWAPAGYNSCDDAQDPISIRKKWFQTLKSQYGDSVWAKSLKYYW